MTTTPKAEPMSDADLVAEAAKLGYYSAQIAEIVDLARSYAASQRPAVPEGVEHALERLHAAAYNYHNSMWEGQLSVPNQDRDTLRAHIAAQGLENAEIKARLKVFDALAHQQCQYDENGLWIALVKKSIALQEQNTEQGLEIERLRGALLAAQNCIGSIGHGMSKDRVFTAIEAIANVSNIIDDALAPKQPAGGEL